MSLVIGRISYLPDDARLRAIRFDAEEKSLRNLLEIKPEGVPVWIVAQNWDEEVNLPQQGRLDVHAMQKRINVPPIGPAAARNILLEEFYASDYDYMLLADDDASLYNYYGVADMLLEMDENPDKFIVNRVHCIKAIEPVYTPFKKANEMLPMQDSYPFCQAPMGNGGGLFIILNLRKHYDQEIYFKTTAPAGVSFREDIDFFIRLMKANFNVLESRNMIQKNTCNDGSKSTVFSGEEDVNQVANAAMRATAREHGIPVVNNRVQFAKVLKFYKGWLLVKRTIPWTGQMSATKRMRKRPKGGLI